VHQVGNQPRLFYDADQPIIKVNLMKYDFACRTNKSTVQSCKTATDQ